MRTMRTLLPFLAVALVGCGGLSSNPASAVQELFDEECQLLAQPTCPQSASPYETCISESPKHFEKSAACIARLKGHLECIEGLADACDTSVRNPTCDTDDYYACYGPAEVGEGEFYPREVADEGFLPASVEAGVTYDLVFSTATSQPIDLGSLDAFVRNEVGVQGVSSIVVSRMWVELHTAADLPMSLQTMSIYVHSLQLDIGGVPFFEPDEVPQMQTLLAEPGVDIKPYVGDGLRLSGMISLTPQGAATPFKLKVRLQLHVTI